MSAMYGYVCILCLSLLTILRIPLVISQHVQESYNETNIFMMEGKAYTPQLLTPQMDALRMHYVSTF